MRRAAIALRPDISPDAIAYIVESLPLTINVLLFENPYVNFTAEQYQALYARFGETPEMLDCLLAREDLPLCLRIAHAKLAAQRIQQLSEDVLEVNQGSLYPALHRLEQKGWIEAEWGSSENNRRARFYTLTRAGRRQLAEETESWHRFAAAVARVLEAT